MKIAIPAPLNIDLQIDNKNNSKHIPYISYYVLLYHSINKLKNTWQISK